jgi:hypothetical protein
MTCVRIVNFVVTVFATSYKSANARGAIPNPKLVVKQFFSGTNSSPASEAAGLVRNLPPAGRDQIRSDRQSKLQSEARVHEEEAEDARPKERVRRARGGAPVAKNQ